MIPNEFIDDVLARTDIVEVIGSRVALKRAGQNHTGLCPFHNEKTPSFSVNQAKQFYYCFGCQASGTALKFLVEHDRMDFVSAVEHLAGRAGMQVPQTSKVDKEASRKRKGLYDILDQSASFYREQLKSHDQRNQAVSYLKKRGLTGAIARDFALGFAPPGWDNLMAELASSNHDRQLLIEAGMVVEKDTGARVHDRFR
ncbi:MAG: DNA primase, partial [Pseudomonadales bacterium]